MTKRHYIEEARRKFLEGIGIPQKSEFVVDDFQREAISAVANGEDTLVVAPTGAGKTYIALESIRATLQMGARAVYTTPLKALSNTKYSELKKLFEPEYKVGLLTGDRKIEGDASVVVATTEIYRNELYRSAERYGLVVLDEVHFIADEQRGPVWEESIILTTSSSTLLMLSASISNAEEIAAWVHEVRGKECRVVIKKERPVQLRYGFLHPELGVLPLRDERGRVLAEVTEYYGSTGLDASGMRLKIGRREGGGGRGGRDFKGSRRGRGRGRGGRGR
jgi:ATP-dependent RNA helicase HelY